MGRAGDGSAEHTHHVRGVPHLRDSQLWRCVYVLDVFARAAALARVYGCIVSCACNGLQDRASAPGSSLRVLAIAPVLA